MTANMEGLPSESVRAEQIERITAMLARWTNEDLSAEPDWDVNEIEPIGFAPAVASSEK